MDFLQKTTTKTTIKNNNNKKKGQIWPRLLMANIYQLGLPVNSQSEALLPTHGVLLFLLFTAATADYDEQKGDACSNSSV